MTLSNVDLENFEQAGTSVPRLSAEYKRGYADALVAAEKLKTAKLTETVERIAATLADMEFGYVEARVVLLDRIRPFLVQIAETILPQILQESFAAHLVDTLAKDFQITVDKPIQIAIDPTALEHVSDAIPDTLGAFVFIGDPSLQEGQARLQNPDTHIMIDLPALMKALQTALSGLEPLERIQSHG